nr:prenylcysteine oxidase 1-like [Procambarus clarkii]XP_045595551.1 prenylcysteine oxidase 1-like [Procambarus clarkii]XP_045595552.1 prenylcysteine oxidase 1-like [Procambarus clarkii]XP_045595553.1 prenylcysteine oxidase 1-like [Procambarus clarkii]
MLQIHKLCLVGFLTQVRRSWTLQDEISVTFPKIAIVGGGIGGTATAYFLQELFGDNVIIDLYESERIGGRLATIPIGEHEYEVGGSIIHPKNQYMLNFVPKLGLEPRHTCKGKLGIFNGETYVFRDSAWDIISLGKLFWRYGWDMYRLNRLTAEMLGDFTKIYKLQSEGYAFKDVASLLHAIHPNFQEMTKKSLAAWLKEIGIHELMIDELITAVTQCNYGQTPSIHAFVGAISVAAADEELWSVLGGNKRVAEELLINSHAAYLRRYVTEVAQNKGYFTVTSTETVVKNLFTEGNPNIPEMNSSYDPRTQQYDIVIFAAPLTKDKSSIKLVNFTKDLEFPGRYERILCTMVQGEVRPESLLLTPEDDIDEILVSNPGLIFNSFGKQCPVDNYDKTNSPDVWKIFSSVPLGEEQLDIFFKKRNSTDVIDWLAYPRYDSDQQLGNFELLPGVYYVNTIEWAGSAMEMSAIGAKNVALLAFKYWLQDPNAGILTTFRDEL